MSKRAIDKIENPIDDFFDYKKWYNGKREISTIVVTPPNWWDIHNRIYTDVAANLNKDEIVCNLRRIIRIFVA